MCAFQGISRETFEAVESNINTRKLVEDGKLEEVGQSTMPSIKAMAKDISKQRNRLGGHWSIAFAIFSREQRDVIREILGPDLVFVIMNLSRNCRNQRLRKRHKSRAEEFIRKVEKFVCLYEPAGENEENAINIDITEDMDQDDVVAKVLELIQ